jgi:predicted deacylase
MSMTSPQPAHLELPQVLHGWRARLFQVAQLRLCDLVISADLVADLHRCVAVLLRGLHLRHDVALVQRNHCGRERGAVLEELQARAWDQQSEARRCCTCANACVEVQGVQAQSSRPDRHPRPDRPPAPPVPTCIMPALVP